MRAIRALLLAGLFAAGLSAPCARSASLTPTEHQIKAVFVYNFSHFVEWPAATFATPTDPFVIGVLGGDALATQLDEAVRGERVDGHTLVVRRYNSADDIGECQILFIDQSQSTQIDRVLAALARRSTLTVSDQDGVAQRGVMIQFAKDNNRIRLLINVDSARAAGLTISSNLLRPATIVRTSD